MPAVIISLDAGDEYLKERVMNLPQAIVEGTHNNEKGKKNLMWTNICAVIGYFSDFLRRLSLFRSQNQEDSTVLNYFDEQEIHIEHISMDKIVNFFAILLAL